MIPLITQTPRLTILAASRALLTAELHKPQYFSTLLGAVMPADWPSSDYDREAMEYYLAQLTAGGRDAAGWYNWYALLKATGDRPRTLVGAGGYMGPPTAEGTAQINYSVAVGWRGQGIGTELVGGLVQQAAATGMVHRLVANAHTDNPASQQVLLHNGFVLVGTGPDDYMRFERAIEPAADPRLQSVT